MQLFISKNKKNGDKIAFEVIKKQILKKPDSLIGLAVGKTTDGLYKLISKDVTMHKKRWEKLKVLQIDENLGTSPDSSISFNFEIRKELKNLFKVINSRNIFLIDGIKNPKSTIKEAYRFINKNKGIDLVVLGLGPAYDPHIAYNTTGKSSINSKMRVVDLHPMVVKQIRCKGDRPVALTKGITLGIKDILECKKALLIAYGKDKAKSLKVALSKVDMKKASASALLLHKDLYIVIDKDAAKQL